MRLDLDQPLKHFQAFVVAGGNGSNYFFGSNNLLSSVVTLLPGATAWTPLASLPRGLSLARASIFAGGRLRVVGGFNYSTRSEVIFATLVTNNNLLPGRCLSITLQEDACGIPDGETIVMTGGGGWPGPHSFVTRCSCGFGGAV